MKKKFLIISGLELFLVIGSFICVEVYLTKNYRNIINYYTYLNVLIYISMVLPLFFLILGIIYESLKIQPEISFNKMVFLVIYGISGVLLFFVTTSFIKFKHFAKFEVLLWILIPILLGLSILISFLLLRNKKETSNSNIVKR